MKINLIIRYNYNKSSNKEEKSIFHTLLKKTKGIEEEKAIKIINDFRYKVIYYQILAEKLKMKNKQKLYVRIEASLLSIIKKFNKTN